MRLVFETFTVAKGDDGIASDQRHSEFIAMLGHELRNSMAPIDRAISIAKRVYGDNPKAVEVLTVAQRQVRHLRTLVDDLLDGARLKHGKLRGNYQGLAAMSQHLMPRASSEMGAAIVLLWRLEPASLGKAIADRDDIYFSLLVRLILGDRTAEFAVHVPLISFKFLLCVENLENAYRRGDITQDWSELLSKLFLRVAQTLEWAGWMQALLRFPAEESLVSLTIPMVLAKLQRHHWSAFVDVLSLGYSKRAAQPVARIMAQFSHETGQEKANELWSICFERWTRWNYGKDEEQFFLFAPAACALDYPIAMYYARLIGSELDGEDAAVALAIETIEQQWFNSSSELVTERNRLLSRIRLVSHGRRLASGSNDLLPPAVTAPDDSYTFVCYGFYDVQAYQGATFH